MPEHIIKPATPRSSETAYLHLQLLAQVRSALLIAREAEVNADVLRHTRPTYADLHAAVNEACRLLMEARIALEKGNT